MATELRLRGGTTAQHASFTGATKEITVDTTKNTVVVHDGSTAGGIPLATENNSVAKGGNTGALTIGTNDATNLTLETNNTARVTVNSEGNVGIGDSDPVAPLTVIGRTVVSADSARPDGDFVTSFRSPSAAAGGRELFQFGRGGYVASGNEFVNLLLAPSIGNNTFNAGWYQEVYRPRTIQGDGNYFAIGQIVRQSTSATQTERMRIDSAGNVGIGENTPVGRLDVSGGFIYAKAAGFEEDVEQIRIGRNDANSRYHSIYSTISSNPNSSALAIRIHDGVTGESQNEVVKFFGSGQQASVIPGGTTLFNEYKCRAWVNFNGVNSGIRVSGNVSSITKIGTGDYRVNFATSMPDNRYSVSVSSSRGGTTNDANTVAQISRLDSSVLAGSVRLITGAPGTPGQPLHDCPIVTCAIFK